MSLAAITARLRDQADGLAFGPPVTHVYNPLRYAWEVHRRYLERYGDAPKEVVLVGMNPGPWGMAQTGVPFGEVGLAGGWLGLEAPVGTPEREHPERPIEGFACRRSEVSGARLWGWARERFKDPERFFERFFVWNYCPLLFLEESGRNRTPNKLPVAERRPLESVCDEALQAAVETLRPHHVVGIGAWATRRCRAALEDAAIPVGRILHPSPASPTANRGWAEQAEAELRELDIQLT